MTILTILLVDKHGWLVNLRDLSLTLAIPKA